MKLLVTIPHFIGNSRSKRYGSLAGQRAPRVRALTACLASLHRLFGGSQCLGSFTEPVWTEVNAATATSLDVLVCTTRGSHVLADVPLPKSWYREVVCRCQPPLLGFECHRLLREHLGRYDYYAYLEDDLVLHDPWLLAKLRWFCEAAGPEALLQPNRYEVPQDLHPRKVYIDGDLPGHVWTPFQDIRQEPELVLRYLDIPLAFRRVSNPHSGCFFLSPQQMEHWAAQPWFLDRDTRFASPLESAATLGIMRTFRVYKPAPAVANFLEIEHCGERQTRVIEQFYQKAGQQQAFGTKSANPSASADREQSSTVVPREPVQALWIGPRLSTMERLSIASFLAQGHPVHLYAYGEVAGIPPGTTMLDAQTILPESEIFTANKGIGKGSYAPFSDVFRYKLLLDKGGWWADLDMIALRPLEFGREYVFGYEGPRMVGSAIFRAPQGCELLRCCYEEADRRRGDIQWGEIGPQLLTRMIAELELGWAAEPRVVFHAALTPHVRHFITPGLRLSRRTCAIHLFRHVWRWSHLDPDGRFPADCIYERLKRRYQDVCDL